MNLSLKNVQKINWQSSQTAYDRSISCANATREINTTKTKNHPSRVGAHEKKDRFNRSFLMVEHKGFEPLTSSMPWKRASQLRQCPKYDYYSKKGSKYFRDSTHLRRARRNIYANQFARVDSLATRHRRLSPWPLPCHGSALANCANAPSMVFGLAPPRYNTLF